MTVYAALLGNMWRTLESYGVNPGQVIDESHFRPGNTVRSAKRISFDEYDATLGRAAARLLGAAGFSCCGWTRSTTPKADSMH